VIAGIRATCDEAGIYLGTSGGEVYYSRHEGDAWDVLPAHLPAEFQLSAATV